MTMLSITKEITDLYAPSARRVNIVNVPEMKFVMIDGQIEMGKKTSTSESFQDTLNVLNGISFTLKFMSKLDRKNPVDYNTMPLEGLWHPPPNSNFKNRSGWKWTLMMMQPEHITNEMFENAIESLKRKRGEIPALTLARCEFFYEGLAMQIMHVSSPGLVPMSLERMKDFAKDEGYDLRGLYHEIYLSDPRLTKPEKQRTILRHPIKIIS